MTLKTIGIAGIASCVAAVAWYLGSPLFIRTTLDEPAPSAAAARSTALPSITSGVTSVATGAAPTTIATGEGVTLRFENVAITNAPEVHVYLSREIGGTWSEATSLYFGSLKATNGSFNYVVPADADLPGYNSVVVWCRQFSVLITWADLR